MTSEQIHLPNCDGDPLDLVTRTRNRLHTIWLQRTYPFAAMGNDVSIDYRCDISRLHAHRVSIGNNVRLAKDVELRISQMASGTGEPVILLEDNCVLHSRTEIEGLNRIHIGRDSIVSQDVLIADHLHAHGGGSIRIGEGGRIGHGAAIICSQGELVLGRHCIVAANAVVTRSAPAYSVLAGNPAIVVQQYDLSKKAWVPGGVRAAAMRSPAELPESPLANSVR